MNDERQNTQRKSASRRQPASTEAGGRKGAQGKSAKTPAMETVDVRALSKEGDLFSNPLVLGIIALVALLAGIGIVVSLMLGTGPSRELTERESQTRDALRAPSTGGVSGRSEEQQEQTRDILSSSREDRPTPTAEEDSSPDAGPTDEELEAIRRALQ